MKATCFLQTEFFRYLIEIRGSDAGHGGLVGLFVVKPPRVTLLLCVAVLGSVVLAESLSHCMHTHNTLTEGNWGKAENQNLFMSLKPGLHAVCQ